MPIKRIIVGTDFSDHAGLAVKQAMHIARHTGAELVLVHAVAATEAQISWTQHSPGKPPLLRQLLRTALAQAHDRLEREYDQLTGQGVEVSQLLADAPAADALCDAAEKLGADLVVVGAGEERPFFGGVAEKVVRRFAGEVLVARGDVAPGGFRKILVPVDFTPRGHRAIELAKCLAAPGAEIAILHVWFPPSALVGAYGEGALLAPSLTEEMIRAARLACDELVERHKSTSFHLSAQTLHGPARTAILEYARDGGFDLVAIGSHGRRGVSRLVLGSVAEAIVRHADGSVLVTHGDGDQP